MHKERILPWQEKGRWYHFFIESDGTTPVITAKDDINVTISSNILKFPAHFRALNWVVDHDNDASSTADYINKKSIRSDGTVAVYLPTPAQYTAADVYVFGYFDEI